MKLSLFTDYALRTLLYLEANGGPANDPQPIPTATIADAYGISRHHLLKVVHRLTELGYIHATRGRTGGVLPARDANTIDIGAIVRAFEPMALVECLDPNGNSCPISPVCGLTGLLARAGEAFLSELDGVTLADLMPNRSPYANILIEGQPPDAPH